MNQEAADTFSARLRDFHQQRAASVENIQLIEAVAQRLTRELVPDKAVLAYVALDGQSAPSLVALEKQQLYLLSVELSDDGDAAAGKAQTIHVTPDTGTVEVETSHAKLDPRYREIEEPPCEATWRFELSNGPRLTLTAKRGLGGSVTGEQECKLAKALATALGWQFPGEPAPDAADCGD